MTHDIYIGPPQIEKFDATTLDGSIRIVPATVSFDVTAYYKNDIGKVIGTLDGEFSVPYNQNDENQTEAKETIKRLLNKEDD